MKKMNIPVGISDFEKIRKENYCYIDKSGLIKELLEHNPAQVMLITRPRRFGKTLAMSCLPVFLISEKTILVCLRDWRFQTRKKFVKIG